MASSTLIDAAKVAWSDGITDSGARLADEVRAAMSRFDRVVVSVEEIRGIPSSYFNAFWARILSDVPPHLAAQRLEWRFASPIQRDIWVRSALAFNIPVP